jgi:putative Mg2+ transporter-C (MgtC) family protein
MVIITGDSRAIVPGLFIGGVNEMVSLEWQAFATIEIIITAVLCFLIGMERENEGKAAGLRTHILTGVGACIFTQLSMEAFPGADTGRIASNVVTGIGFLGAGVIVKRQSGATDLTTAASIWSTAAIGMAVATGAWLLATTGALIIWFILEVLSRFKRPESDPQPNEKPAESTRPDLSDFET